MNHVIIIRLGHYVLTIDEDAAQIITAYTAALRKKYAGEEGAEEIVSDIEERMGELLERKQKDNHRNFNTQSDVQEVIAQLGPMEGTEDSTPGNDTRTRRLFRDPNNRILGGVWGGIGAYFDIDPVILRVIWIISVMALGFGVPLYIILWVVVPEARTTAEKLMMRGERPTLQNIEDNIKSEMTGLSSRLNNPGTRDRFASFIRALAMAFARVFTMIVKSAFALAGGILLMVLIAVLIGVSTNTIYFHEYHFVLNGQEGLNTILSSAGDPFWIKTAVIVFILLLMAWTGLIVFSNRRNRERIAMPRRYLGWAAICAALIIFVFAFDGVRSLSSRSERRAFSEVIPVIGDTLVLNAAGINTDAHGLYTLNELADIYPSEDGSFRIEQHNITYGHNRISSTSRSNAMAQLYQIEGNRLTIQQGQVVKDLAKNGLGWVKYRIYVPKGKTIQAGLHFQFTENNYTSLSSPSGTLHFDTAGYSSSPEGQGISLQGHIEKIIIEGKFDVQIIHSDHNRLELVSGPVLNHSNWIDADGSIVRIEDDRHWINDPPSYLRLYLNDLEYLECSSVARVRFKNWKCTELNLECDGASEVSGNLTAGKIYAEVDGSAKAIFDGRTEKAEIHTSGAAVFDGSYLQARNATVEGSGASRIIIWAEDILEGESSGACSISAKGNPRISRVETSGAGSFKRI